MNETVAWIGAGALGVMYGWEMTKALGPARVFFAVDDARAAAYRHRTFTCNGQPCCLRFETPAHARPVTLAVFATKSTGLAAAIETMRPFVGPDTILLSVLNGISSEEALCAAFGSAHVLYAVAQGTDAGRVGGAVEYSDAGCILLGSREGARTPDVETAARLLGAGRVPHRVCGDILQRQWSKLMLNVGLNQACAVYDVPYGGICVPGEARDTMLAAMREVQAVAACEGIALTDADIDAWMAMTETLRPEGMPSMRQDTLAGRPTEVELFAGTVRRLGRKHGVPTPVNDRLYERIAAIEAAYAPGGAEKK